MAKPWYKEKGEIADPEHHKPATQNYRKGWDGIWGRKEEEKSDGEDATQD